MWNLDIPKIMHIYWGGEVLPYMRLLTFKSFLKYNPDWEIWLWTAKDIVRKVTWASLENAYDLQCNNFLPVLMNMPIKKNVIDFVKLGFSEEMAEVHKADYTRISVLYKYGGAWADTDIIFFKSMNELSVNRDTNKDKEVFVSICGYGHSVGFLMATPHSVFFKKLLNNIKNEFNPTHYQCIGSCMFNKYYPTLDSIPRAVNIPMDAVYRYNANGVKDLLKQQKADFTVESIGCHWYGGNTLWTDFIRKTNGGCINIPSSIIGNLLKGWSNPCKI